MKTAIITIGPPGAGKTTYCERVVAANPDIRLVSADTFLRKQFGKIGFDPYTGELQYVWECFWKYVRWSVKKTKTNGTLILDCWNPTSYARSKMQKRLREYGIGKIVGWYFITPCKTCGDWWVKRECKDEAKDSLEFTRRTRSLNARIFHREASDVREGIGFDGVRHIDVQHPQLFPNIFPV